MTAAADPNAWRLATVRSVVRETIRAVTVRFDVPGWPGHLAGQRIDVRLTAEDGYSAVRAYSMSSPPGSPTVDVTVERVPDGEVSPFFVEEVRAGDEIEVRGPIGGAFTWTPAQGGPILLVGGGSGIVPLMAMVRAHAAAGDDADVRLALSARTIEDVIFAEELRELGETGTIRLLETLTRGAPPWWHGATGRVDLDMLSAFAPSPADEPTIYICGPEGFVETVVAILLTIGHDPAAIRTERFGLNG
ncbi:MAG: ferredoxin reductase [Solirubrobacteraceae bacterium]|nr:ferredoxin reductase [Patulibacter sp.]